MTYCAQIWLSVKNLLGLIKTRSENMKFDPKTWWYIQCGPCLCIMKTCQDPSLNHLMLVIQQSYLPIHPYWSISTATLAPVMHTYRCVRLKMRMMHHVPMMNDVACMTSGAFSWCFFTSHWSHDHTFRLPLPILLPQDRTLSETRNTTYFLW